MAEIDDLRASVAKEATVEAGVVTLLQELTAQIGTLVQNATDLNQLKASITEVTTQVNTQAQTLADSVVANTPTPPAQPA